MVYNIHLCSLQLYSAARRARHSSSVAAQILTASNSQKEHRTYLSRDTQNVLYTLPAVPSLHCKAVSMESVGTVCKAKTKYLKLMYVYHSVRKTGYAYELNICDSIARFFFYIHASGDCLRQQPIAGLLHGLSHAPPTTNPIVNFFSVGSNPKITDSLFHTVNDPNARNDDCIVDQQHQLNVTESNTRTRALVAYNWP